MGERRLQLRVRPELHVSEAELRRVTEVAYLGCVYGTMAALTRMRPRNRGTIVQVESALVLAATGLLAAATRGQPH
jgi:NAD(P)-dependent dehydrogenase (short-subunit alcohol dehydrogenase family)